MAIRDVNFMPVGSLASTRGDCLAGIYLSFIRPVSKTLNKNMAVVNVSNTMRLYMDISSFLIDDAIMSPWLAEPWRFSVENY
ncbi:MAG: hypothetical protein CL569_11365 [Alphaproteobacteria bacterium]|nr:hypothetical protein [Alphaproteobacteria bacterium]|tara:strand:+ start:156 stop:401 length:246 start_codon:yes stop_codon:yes gene_type:complete